MVNEVKINLKIDNSVKHLCSANSSRSEQLHIDDSNSTKKDNLLETSVTAKPKRKTFSKGNKIVEKKIIGKKHEDKKNWKLNSRF